MSLRGYRTKLYILLPLAWLLGVVLARDAVTARSHPHGTLVYGRVVGRQLQANQWGVKRPLLTIQISDTTTLVHASLEMNSGENIRDSVSFFYSGNPSQEVYLQQETDPLWGALFFFLLPPIGLLIIHCQESRENKQKGNA